MTADRQLRPLEWTTYYGLWCHRFVLSLLRFFPLLLCFASVTIFAAPLTLQQAENQLLQSNHAILAARRALEGATADITIAGQAPNPTVSYSTTDISRRNGVGGGSLPHKRMDQTVSIQQQIERGDRRELRRNSATALELAARADYADVCRQQRLLLHQAWFDLLAASERKRLLLETASLYQRGMVATELRLKLGDVSRVEASRLRIEALRAENDARLASADQEKALARLSLLLGNPSTQAIEPAGDWPAIQSPEKSLALEGRPDVRAAASRIESSERKRSIARSLTTRDLTVGAQVERFGPAPGVTYGVSIAMPLFVRYGFEGEQARAEAEYSAAIEERERTLRTAYTETEQARADLTAAIDRLQRIESDALPQAREVGAASELAYRKGAIGLTDLLDARRTLRAVELEVVAARADHAKARAAWLAATQWEISE